VTSAPVASDRLTALFASDPAVMADPGAVWREVRESGPVVRNGPSYLLTRHVDVRAALRDPARFSSDSSQRGTQADHMRAILSGETLRAFEEMYEFQSLFLVENDEPRHTRMRRIVHRAFTPRRIGALEAATARYVDENVTELAAQGEVVDLKQLAYRVPLLIIGDLVGVPRQDQEQIKEWSDVWGRHRLTPDDRLLLAWQAQQDLRAYVEEMIERHRRRPEAGDLISAMVGAEHDEVLSTDELAALFFILIFGGHETTTNLLATGTLELLRRPEQWRAICDDPELIPGATEELIRHVSPVQWITRRATEDTEVAGCSIPAESHVFIGLASANRDPDVFTDPDEVDVRRANAGQHVALGLGAHFCLGASLARLEGSITFRTLTRRFPQLTLASETQEWTGYAQLRTLASLPVRLGPEANGS
jgi:cytochrome P450